MNKGLTKLQIALAFIATLIILTLSITPLISVLFDPIAEIENRLGNVFDSAQKNELNGAKTQEEIDEINKKYEEVNKMIAIENGVIKITLAPKDFVLGAVDATKLLKFVSLIMERDAIVEAMNKPEYNTQNEESDTRKLQLLDKQIGMFDGSAINVRSVSVLLILFKGVLGVASNTAESGVPIGSLMIMVVQLALLIGVYVGIPLKAILTALKMLKAVFTGFDDYGDKYSLVVYRFFSLLTCFATLIATVAILSAEFTRNGMIMILVVLAIFFIYFIVSRIKRYDDIEKKSLNLEQLTALIAAAGAAIFVFGILECDLVGHLIGPDITASLLKKYGDIDSKGFLYSSLGVGALAVFVQITCVATIKAAVSYMTYFSCMLDRGDEGNSGKKGKKRKPSGNNGIGPVILSLIIIAIAVAVMVVHNAFLTEGISSFLIAVLGLIIALVARRIAFKKSVNEFTALTYEQRRSILCGVPANTGKAAPSSATATSTAKSTTTTTTGNSSKNNPAVVVRREGQVNRATIVEVRGKGDKPNMYVKRK